MSAFNSIRWRLQLWYGVFLLIVLAAFSLTDYLLERERLLGKADDELVNRANTIAMAFRPPPPPPRDRGPNEGPFDRPPQPDAQMRPPRPPRQGRPFNDGPGPFPLEPGEFRLPPRLADLFEETDTNGFYYVLNELDGGKELVRSANAPAEVPLFPVASLRRQPGPPGPPGLIGPPNPDGPRPGPNGPPPLLRREPPPLRTRGKLREVALIARRGEALLVGRSIAPELHELRRVGVRLGTISGVILLFGLAGGWWLASRAIRPINDISGTAAKIAAGDLSQRISIQDTETELGRLAHVLNSTFARLDAAFTQQQQFTSDAAHELRTPVSVMLTQAQTALNRERSAPEYRETIEACQRAAQRMRRLIESLLELARIDAGQEPMKRMPMDLAHIAADCVELVRPLTAGRGILIHTDFATADCQGDSERIAQVVTNLLTNAIHYNKDGGEIRISTRRENGFALLAVADTGVGIGPEHLPRVFERFYRSDPSRTGVDGRSGLGLAISKAIVEAHGGSIEVVSDPGFGATFVVRLAAG